MQSTCDETGKDTMVKDFLINYNLYNLFKKNKSMRINLSIQTSNYLIYSIIKIFILALTMYEFCSHEKFMRNS